jgi:hypothetical protein
VPKTKTAAAGRALSLRELNRTTLARQFLLERVDLPVVDVVTRLVALQAQLARPPYVGLWTRLTGFTRTDLSAPIEHKRIIKATFLRGTLHLLTARDYLKFRATLQPVLTSALDGIVKQRGAQVDVPRLVEAVRAFMLERPCSFAQITTLLKGLVHDGDPGAMRYAVRTHLPMVQVPIQKGWSFPGNPEFTLADAWLGTTVPTSERLPDLVKRYLAAFGPATIKDMETWSYLKDLQPVFEAMRSELVVYRTEQGRRMELFDLADSPIADRELPAAVRFLPEFDNLLLAHQDRTRVVPKAYRSKVYLPGLRVAATVLVDGFVAATWITERVKQTASIIVSPLEPLGKAVRAHLTDEGEQLVRFVEADAQSFEVRIVE